MDSFDIPDWRYLFEDNDRSILGKRKENCFGSLAHTIDIANDMELHANFLLEEALAQDRKELPTHNISNKEPQSISSIPATESHDFYQMTAGDTALSRKKLNTASINEKKIGSSYSNPARDTNYRPSAQNKGNSKDPVSFSSAKDSFLEDGGKFSHRKDDYVSTKQVGSSSRKATESDLPEELSGFDKAIVDKIESEIIHRGQPVKFDDISGLEFAKQCVVESVCWPISNPQLFQGLRKIPRGILLFGPPGTGKTLIGKAIANQSGATFFSISASSLMSKWIGEGEKTVKTLFAVASYRQPSVVFIDEIDSLLCQRSADENEATRRVKTEFLVQLDGAGTDLDARVVIVGATNRPEELDEAVRRRFVKRLYIPLPDEISRRQLFDTLLAKVVHELSSADIVELVDRTRGFSGADIQSLCTEAAMGPLRELARNFKGRMNAISPSEVPPIKSNHFQEALQTVQPSVSPNDLKRYLDWNSLFGSYRVTEDT